MTIGLITLLAIIIFRNNIVRNYQLYKLVNEKFNYVSQIELIPMRIDSLQKLINKIDGTRLDFDTGKVNESNQDLLLKFLADFSIENNIKVINLPSSLKQSQGATFVEINNMEIESDFNTLLNLLYGLENDSKLGNVVSSSFFISKNFKSEKKYLHLKVYTKKFSNIKVE